jgi:aminoglycoside phosphotransferase family enzyme/predicted kinase
MDAAVVETHVSVVFFVGDHAYKLKKPVVFPFADLSTREARQSLCFREVELNRRLAPDVYEGVAEVTDPDGSPCDHLVVMRRMPADRRLSTLVREGDPRAREVIGPIATRLTAFHEAADRSSLIDAGGTTDEVRGRWHRNADQMRPLAGVCFEPAELERAMTLADRFLAGRQALFDQRIAIGAVCDGHGDLMADDIFVLDDGPRILDCVEFDDRLRYVDVVDDVAFLVMDLERLGAPDLGRELVRAYERESGDPVPRNLLHFYVAYRAQVRAMVAGLRAAQCDDPTERAVHEAEATRLLHQCVDRLERGTCRLVIVGGLPGTGKSTVSEALARRHSWSLLRSDVLRKELAGLAPDEAAPSAFGDGIYTSDMTTRTYDALLDEARRLLGLGVSVVVDASFVSARARRAARSVADEADAEMVELRCTVDRDEADRRMRSRLDAGDDASDADPAIAARLAATADPWPESTEISTEGPLEQVVDVASAAANAVASITGRVEV